VVETVDHLPAAPRLHCAFLKGPSCEPLRGVAIQKKQQHLDRFVGIASWQ
jgi:hypothetical protein